MTAPARVDLRRGLFETLLVSAGQPIELAAHLERLAASCELLYGAELPADTPDVVRQAVAGVRLGRLRLTVTVTADGPGVDTSVVEVDPAVVFPAPELGAATLRTLRLSGGLGAHKWVDRAALGTIPDPAVALLLDDDGTVLEASRANVFAVRDGAIVTPPADGRILAGIARRGAIEVAGETGVVLREERLGLDDLLGADEVFLTGSVRGVQRAGSLDGAPLPPAGELSRRVADGLRRRWML